MENHEIHSIERGYYRNKNQQISGLVQSLVFSTIESNWEEGSERLIYTTNWWKEKIAVIDYKISSTWEYTTCYISFFATQNADPESWYTEIQLLDIPKNKQKGLSYEIMIDFIENYCLIKSVKRIYIDADLWKKTYWKEKMWKFLKEKWLIKKIWSQSQEVCFVLET